MPCWDTHGTCESTHEKELWARHDSEVAEFLCQAMQAIDSGGAPVPLPPGVMAWWEEHQDRDRRRAVIALRQAEEAGIRQAALAKLTPYERKLLGLK
jgi:hypothetical protein